MSDVGAALCHRGSKHLHQRRLSRATPDLAYQGFSHRGSAIEVPKGTGQELPIGGGRKAPKPAVGWIGEAGRFKSQIWHGRKFTLIQARRTP